MNYNIQFVQTGTVENAENLIVEKLDKLGEKYDWVINADIFFKKEKDTHGKGFICEAKLSLPGPLIFASSDEDSFEAAAAETINDLERQLRKRKDEMKAHR